MNVHHGSSHRTLDAVDEPPGDVVTVKELEELRAESRRRQAELRQLAAALPPAQSRRQLVAQMFSDLAHAPDKAGVARRVVVKILRTPVDLIRRTGE